MSLVLSESSKGIGSSFGKKKRIRLLVKGSVLIYYQHFLGYCILVMAISMIIAIHSCPWK